METLWVDFNNAGQEGIRLICNGTLKEIAQKGIKLYDGLELKIWHYDEMDDGTPDNLSAEAIVKYSIVDSCWVAQISPQGMMHSETT